MVMVMTLEPVVWVVSVAKKTDIIHFHCPISVFILILFHSAVLYSANLVKFAVSTINSQMKFFKYIILTALLAISLPSFGQDDIRASIDTDLHSLRNCVIPDFHYTYDDYLQYAPAAVLVGMKACGYESRSGWGRMLVSDAFSAAIMAGVVNGLKYSVGRLRPDGSRHNSFPSGHTATAFMTAAMLHMEYGWRSPWFSIGGYTAAAVTGVSRILNNRHWMSDVVAGAAIGIGSVHLGYFITDCIFKEKNIYDGYVDPEFYYDPTVKHYVAELLFGRRFILGGAGYKAEGAIPIRGGLAGVSVDVPLIPGIGITARATGSSLTYASSEVLPLYTAMAGGFYNLHFAKILEFQAKLMAGYAWGGQGGFGVAAGVGLSLMTNSNFKIKAFTDLESMSLNPKLPWLSTLVVGFSTAWFW